MLSSPLQTDSFAVDCKIGLMLYLSTILPTFPSQAESQRRINVEGLLDTGYLAGDFVARRIVEKNNIQPILQSISKLSVCSGLDNCQ